MTHQVLLLAEHFVNKVNYILGFSIPTEQGQIRRLSVWL